jgi:hypothetical protein
VPLKTPLSAVTSSFLAARSTASSFRLAARHLYRNRRLRPAALPWHCLAHTLLAHAGQDDALNSCPPSAALAAPGSRGSNRSRGFRPQNGLSPSVQASRIKPGAWVRPSPGTCSLGQDGLPETAGRPWRHKKNLDRPRPPSDRSHWMSKRKEVLIAVCSMKRAKARRHTGPARPDAYVETSSGFAKWNRRLGSGTCGTASGRPAIRPDAWVE